MPDSRAVLSGNTVKCKTKDISRAHVNYFFQRNLKEHLKYLFKLVHYKVFQIGIEIINRNEPLSIKNQYDYMYDA